jgi:transformation/transcription domain-associated protein
MSSGPGDGAGGAGSFHSPMGPTGGFPQVVTSPQGGPTTSASNIALDHSTSSTSTSSMSVFLSSGSGSTMNWEPVRSRLLGTDLDDALAAATELREGIEIVHTTEFPLMLSALLPAFSTILTNKTKPNPDTLSTQHKLRNTILEIISRMPSNEVLRPHAPHLVAVALDILNRDYEENALLASKIVFDLYKVYRSLPQDYVQPFLDFVVSSYKTLPGAVSLK